jgi:hypothetical protein
MPSAVTLIDEFGQDYCMRMKEVAPFADEVFTISAVRLLSRVTTAIAQKQDRPATLRSIRPPELPPPLRSALIYLFNQQSRSVVLKQC